MKTPFSIILRTFGSDLDSVIKELEKQEGIKFKYRGKYNGPQLIIEGEIKSEKEGFEMFIESDEHFAIQDDWTFWTKDGERGRSGKRFLYDRSSHYLSLFFDDNITGQEMDIVKPLEIFGNDVKKNEDLLEEILFPVVIKDAIVNNDYYLDKYMLALDKAKNRIKGE